jgi:hypothetical protein
MWELSSARAAVKAFENAWFSARKSKMNKKPASLAQGAQGGERGPAMTAEGSST